MSTNGKWFRSYWIKGGSRVNPTKAGWYAAIPEDCNRCIHKVLLSTDLLSVYVEGDDLNHDVYDFNWWYPLNNQNDRLPDFP
jgi:hypothetical protein